METTQQCSRCKEDKILSLLNFRFRPIQQTWYTVCRACYRKTSLLYDNKNWQRLTEIRRARKQKNPDRYREALQKWRKAHPERAKQISKAAYQKRYATPQGKLNNHMSVLTRKALCKNKGGRSWETFVDYSTLELKQHLENLFIKGMSWENYGQWHVDHVIARCHFHFTFPEDPEFKACWKLTNLQPMWGSENNSKGKKSMEEYLAKKISKNLKETTK